MHSLAIILFGLAVLVSFGATALSHAVGTTHGPNAAGAGIGIVFVAILRGAITAAGMLLLVGAGKLDGMISGRGSQAAAMLGAVAVVELVSCFLNFLYSAGAERGGAVAVGVAALGLAIPAVLLTGGALAGLGRAGAGTWMTAAVGLAVFGGIGAVIVAAREDAKLAAEREREQQVEAAVVAEVQALRAETPVETILPYLDRMPTFNRKREVTARLRQAPEARRAIAEALRGGQRRLAMEALELDEGLREEDREGEYWQAAGAMAEDLQRRGEAGAKEVATLERFVQMLAMRGRKGGPVYAEEAVAVRRYGEAGHGRLRELATHYLTQAMAR